MSRTRAIDRALAQFDAPSGGYFTALAELCAMPTESQNSARLPDLRRYLDDGVGPRLVAMGYVCRVYENPVSGAGPVLLATRIEDAAKPTYLCYGHGDVVLGMEGRWAEGRDPWTLSFEGDRVYGRGVVDNKGQHLAHMLALASIIDIRGELGFNHKFMIEMGEENGSKGLAEIVAGDRTAFAADAFFASDGPRTEMSKPNITLGNRGCCNFNLSLALRSGGHHSGNWGGLLANPAIVLAHALASITGPHGAIRVPEWRPDIPPYVREVLLGLDREAGPNAPTIDDNWGEPGLTRIEKVSAFNTFEVLAWTAGNPDSPVNAIPPSARATCQLRYVHGTDEADILPALRRHLDEHGFGDVRIEPPPAGNDGRFLASRTDPRHPWAQWMKAAVERSSNQKCGVLPNSGGSNMTHIVQYILEAPITWLPLSYGGCSQHAPNEHMLRSLTREGLRHVTGIYWDLGAPDTAYRPPR